MGEVEVTCAVYGEGTVFPVKIQTEEKVSALQEAIVKEKKDVNARFNVDPATLTLNVAKKNNGPWLTDDDTVDALLKRHVDTGYMKMRPSSKLNNDRLLGSAFKPGEDEIHILVQRPPLQTPPELSSALRDLRRAMAEVRRGQEEAQRGQEEAQRGQEEALAEVQSGQEEVRRVEEEARRVQEEAQRRQEEALAEVQRRQIEDGFSRKRDYESASFSDGALGHHPFWSTEVQERASAFTNEAEFDSFVAPLFNEVIASCGLDLVFVNSERDPWLSQGEGNLNRKPEAFFTHRGMYRAKPTPQDQVSCSPSGELFRFGEPIEKLFDSVIILFKSKLTLGTKTSKWRGFGQVVRSLQHLHSTGSASAILFDRHSFWLVVSYKSVIVKVVQSKWVHGGSKDLFRNFILNKISPWVKRLAFACSKLGVHVVEGDAFLGCGARMVAFSSVRLYIEQVALTKAQHTGLTARPVGECMDTHDGGAALLLSPVGTSLPYPTTKHEVHTLFELLWQLHEKNVVHGDPCVSNAVVQEDGRPLWIDLTQVNFAIPKVKEVDAQILTWSILGTTSLDPAVTQLIGNYGKKLTQENLHFLAEGVWQELKLELASVPDN